VLPASRDALLARLEPDALVLDVGGWAKPFARADWVIDLSPYETRGLYGYDEGERATERFTAEEWVIHDICATEPWPFADDQFDFAICSHTLEDVRDPVRACEGLTRVARAGYVEVPSRLEEQMPGVQGPWVGWGHHRWLCGVRTDGIDFVFKHHIVHAREDMQVPHRPLIPRGEGLDALVGGNVRVPPADLLRRRGARDVAARGRAEPRLALPAAPVTSAARCGGQVFHCRTARPSARPRSRARAPVPRRLHLRHGEPEARRLLRRAVPAVRAGADLRPAGDAGDDGARRRAGRARTALTAT
jgi:Methyltransferase domain